MSVWLIKPKFNSGAFKRGTALEKGMKWGVEKKYINNIYLLYSTIEHKMYVMMYYVRWGKKFKGQHKEQNIQIIVISSSWKKVYISPNQKCALQFKLKIKEEWPLPFPFLCTKKKFWLVSG